MSHVREFNALVPDYWFVDCGSGINTLERTDRYHPPLLEVRTLLALKNRVLKREIIHLRATEQTNITCIQLIAKAKYQAVAQVCQLLTPS